MRMRVCQNYTSLKTLQSEEEYSILPSIHSLCLPMRMPFLQGQSPIWEGWEFAYSQSKKYKKRSVSSNNEWKQKKKIEYWVINYLYSFLPCTRHP